MNKNQLEQKFSRHIGRILHKLDSVNPSSYSTTDHSHVKSFTKGELWLLCQDLVIMLEMNESNENESKETNYNR